ncbi:MAG: DUF2336 domain-containing protein [Alphaproteobacteria bacterium]|nr:DUF2336 domain-containing protein [Alphaproteobacteria bacterium]
MSSDVLLTLKELAANPTQLARSNLFERIGDVALSDAEHWTPQVKELVDDILVSLVKRVEVDARARLAARLADQANVPQKLLHRLAADEIEIARPILERSPALVERDLLALIAAGSAGHREAIAGRAHVPSSVGDALIGFDEMKVLERLAANDGAELSRAALSHLATRSRESENLRRLLLDRADLPAEFAHKIFWWVSAALRAHILEHYEIDRAVLDRALTDILKQPPRTGRIARTGEMSAASIIAKLRARDGAGAIDHLAALLGVARETAARIVADEGGEALAVACKAIGASKQDFATLLLLFDFHRSGKARPAGRLNETTQIYDRLAIDRAKATAKLWDLDVAAKAA